MENQRTKQVVIAGGGITGLSAAYYIEHFCRANDIAVELIIVEKRIDSVDMCTPVKGMDS